jgi:hypothetical protein
MVKDVSAHCLQIHGVRIVAFNKCGHTSVINTFKTGAGNVSDRSAKKPDGMLQGNGHAAERWPEPIVTIAYFRHPLARVAAVWNHLVRGHHYTPFKAMGFTRDMEFVPFCQHLLWIRDDYLDPHVEHQNLQFRQARGWLGETQIFRLDEISTCWPQMVRTWGLECTTNVAHLNNNSYPEGKPWTALFDGHEQIAFDLMQMYREDHQIWQDRRVP